MYNYVNTVLAILERARLITPEAGTKLSKELQSGIHQSRYEDAVAMVKEVENKISKLVDEPWNTDVAKLELRIKNLEQDILTIAKKLETAKPAKAKPVASKK